MESHPGGVTPSRLREETELSKAQLVSAIGLLKGKGLLEATGGRQKTVYRLPSEFIFRQ